MESEYFEKLLDQRIENLKDNQEYIKERLDAILEQTKKTNGRVTELEKWKSATQGHWQAVVLVFTILGFVIGIISVYLWH
ncbi:MAG: hypothetical protein RI909_1885 [Bacteroidota bacterium]